MTRRNWTRFALFLGVASLALASARAAEDTGTGVEAELEKARKLDAASDRRNACLAFQRANELAQGKSVPSLIGLSSCYTQIKKGDKAVAVARQAVAVAADPEERTEATTALGYDLLRQPDEASWTEAATLFREQVAASNGAKGRAGLLTALLTLHRDPEAAEMLQSLRKEGKSEDEIRQEVLSEVSFESLAEDTRRNDDFDERLLRLDPEAPLRVGGSVRRPEILHQVKPEMPAEARRSGLAELAIVETIIDARGNIHTARLLKDPPYGLGQAALDAVKQWTFKPATFNGKPVAVIYILTVHFQMSK